MGGLSPIWRLTLTAADQITTRLLGRRAGTVKQNGGGWDQRRSLSATMSTTEKENSQCVAYRHSEQAWMSAAAAAAAGRRRDGNASSFVLSIERIRPTLLDAALSSPSAAGRDLTDVRMDDCTDHTAGRNMELDKRDSRLTALVSRCFGLVGSCCR